MTGLALKMPGELVRRIQAHGVETYPHECCGALLGVDVEGSREVADLLPLPNRRSDSPRNRFELAPDDVLKAEKGARERGLELLGWYHSHPDAPARPSEFDREHAWPWYSYVIVSVEKGEPREVTSWRLRDDRSAYDAESIEICGSNQLGRLASIGVFREVRPSEGLGGPSESTEMNECQSK